ncbi:hypothetical protein [Segniliparus rugosus]|uniref:PknH-like extracellular domain-containing protein n=1 Tax=Segniliparus rugosus (strain ATCC BAA-974 / DSM 45345 / CCUG 50838 / CIP 108380 / JCM 13579 / CDC 945) TaxID=679197 RepID=E5XSB2_SEGRC|nr:hypothetical protein [Segniliparus rugosus]EFV12756.1 hypothetical protein HMPREF9336_02384 [Segniliparus rugosus ATCC BAA-974]
MRDQTTGVVRTPPPRGDERATAPAARRAALHEKRQRLARSRPGKDRRTLLDRVTSWRTLGILAAICAVAAAGSWFWPKPREHSVNPAAMRITTEEFPAGYITKEGLSLSSVAFPQQNLPNTKYEPPRCAEFTAQNPLAEVGDGKASYGVQRGSNELRTMALGVVGRVVSWDQFVQFAQSCPTFSMTNSFGGGDLSIQKQQPPGSSADEAVSYFLTTHSAKDRAAKDSSMLVILAHVSDRTVFAGLTLQSLKATTPDQLPDRDAFTKLYATLVQRVKDNS